METIVKRWIGSPVKATATTAESEPFSSTYDGSRSGFLVTNTSSTGYLRLDNVSGEVAAGTPWYKVGPGQTIFIGFWDALYIATVSGSVAYKAQQVVV